MYRRYCNTLFRMHNKTNLDLLRNMSDKDPAPLFFNPDVQKLLKMLTRVDMKTAFRTRKLGQRFRTPQYKFMTTEELNKAMESMETKVWKKLQMPPVLKIATDVCEVLSADYELQGFSEEKFVCTDITYGISDTERLIVVRDVDGVLRKANREERFRMIETYFPTEGRKIRMPKMFEEEYLKKVLERGDYEFILDRACLQFEPDDQKYQEITTTTYEAVDASQHYNALRSTRHFGPFVFHLAWNRSIDNLLIELLQTDRLDEAVALIKLYHTINPAAKSAVTAFEKGQEHKFIQNFIQSDSNKKAMLELTLQANIELWKQREEVELGVRRAHGHT